MIQTRADDHSLAIVGLRIDRLAEDPAQLLSRVRNRVPGVEVQIVRADRIAGIEHVQFAVEAALRSFRKSRQRSKTLAMEVLLHLSGQRQISKAVEMLGVNKGSTDLIVILSSGRDIHADSVEKMLLSTIGGEPADYLLEVGPVQRKSRELCETFRIGKRELEAARLPHEDDHSVLKRLVIERSALLEFDKR